MSGEWIRGKMLGRGPLWKDVTPKKTRATKHRQVSAVERVNKQLVRERDGRCRFPRCGCWPVQATVSHDVHKGMGGDPTGERSLPSGMIVLCRWRHQDAPVSRHAGTMRTRYLTTDQNDGPVCFEVDLWAVYPGLYPARGVWFAAASESNIGVLEPLTFEQQRVLGDLAAMTR